MRGEHVVLSAHWDAYGIGKPVEGDSIYNGTLDDGSGVTALLALARVFARAVPQSRSLTFLFTTAEEWGLFGAYAFVCSGPIPLDRIAANLNLDDGIELLGPKKDAAPLGVELSTLGETRAEDGGSQEAQAVTGSLSGGGVLSPGGQLSICPGRRAVALHGAGDGAGAGNRSSSSMRR